MKVLKLSDLIKLRSAIFMYKVNRKILPEKLLSMFKLKTVEKKYNLRNKNDIYYRFARTKQKQMCLSIYGIKLWNMINDEIKKCKSIQVFKSKFKSYLINNY